MNINTVALTGNLTKDPELRHTAGGTPVCQLRIANNERIKRGDQWEDKANYFTVIAFGRMGESCAQYLSKGRPVAVQGRLSWREWQSDNGPKREQIEIIAATVQFLGSRDGGGSQPSSSFSGGDVPLGAETATATDFGTGGNESDFGTGGHPDPDSDIPFMWVDGYERTERGCAYRR